MFFLHIYGELSVNICQYMVKVIIYVQENTSCNRRMQACHLSDTEVNIMLLQNIQLRHRHLTHAIFYC